MSHLKLFLLGPFTAELDGVPLTGFATDKVRALLAYLAIEGDQAHRRESLATLLWSDYSDTDALTNMRKALHRLRQALGDDIRQESQQLLTVTPQTVQLNVDSYWVDAQEFEDLLARRGAHSHRKADSCATCNALLTHAISLYRGDLLAGFHFEGSQAFNEWVTLRREGLHRDALYALTLLANYHATRFEDKIALRYVYRQLQLEPWHEGAYRLAMSLLARDGQRSAALAQYEACRRTLRDELDAEPEAATTALYEKIKRGENGVEELQAHGLLNLPQQLTSFVGREAELERIGERLDSADCRLVTLAGPGGVGKTRLALQIAFRQKYAFSDGVCFVPLGALSPQATTAIIATAIAQAVGLRFEVEQPAEAQLLHYLRDREMLLVLDNFEHVLEAGADLLISTLKAAPRISLLITSRERLALQAEYIFDIPGLPLDDANISDPHTQHAIRDAQSPGAVQLFVERARQVQSHFALSSDNAGAVSTICTSVAGLPLGIELAAAQVREHPPAEIASSISSNLDFLTSSLRDASSHHKSLRAVFNYSWALLSDEERSALRELTVFRGGWEAEAAQEVASASGETLSSLARKSLLRKDASGRYDIHEALRQYAAEQLDGTPSERDTTIMRHAAYFLKLAQEAEAELQGPEQAAWLERLDREHNNLRAAIRLASFADASLQGNRPSVGVAMGIACALWRFWEMRGYLSEGRAQLEAVLALVTTERSDGTGEPAGEREDPLRAKALTAAGNLARRQGDYGAAHSLFREALAIFRWLGNRPGEGSALNSLGLMAQRQGDYPTARVRFEESLEIMHETDNQKGASAVLGNLGNVAQEQGEYEAARMLQEESLLICREVGDLAGSAATLASLGLIAQEQGEYEAARAFHEEGLAIRRELGYRWAMSYSIHDLGELAYEEGDYEAATRLLGESLDIRRELHDKRGIALSLVILGFVARELGEHEVARTHLTESLALAQGMGDRYAVAWSMEGLASLAALEGTVEGAREAARLWGATEALREAIGSPIPRNERHRHDFFEASAREICDVQAFEVAWADGRSRTLDEIVEHALKLHV